MPATALHHLEPLILAVLLFVVVLAALANRYRTPYPIILVIGGALLGLIPHVPHLRLNPDVFFLLILPPLVFSGAFLMPWREFRNDLATILTLAFGLVGFTVFGVAATVHYMLPGFDWRTGLVLGAIASTTDPIAAVAIARRLGLPLRIRYILEGESLANDATGLVAFAFTTMLLVSGRTPSFPQGAARLLYLVFGSIAIGLIAGKIVHEIERRIAEAPIEITLSIIAPYFAYLGAESLRASGVMATVACGLFLGHTSSVYYSRDARVESSAVWNTLTFALNGVVFILIGLQLPFIRAQIHFLPTRQLAIAALVFSAAVILLRLLWMFPAAGILNRLSGRILRRARPFPNRRFEFLLGWTGMRGALALAAAVSLPEFLNNRMPFPQRGVIIFLTFCVIFVTLVLQGLTLPPLIRALGLAGGATADVEEENARRVMSETAVQYLESARRDDRPEFGPLYEELLRFERRRLSVLKGEGEASATGEFRPEDYRRMRSILQQMRRAQRGAVVRLRDQNEINGDLLRRLEHELDLLETPSPASEHVPVR